MAKHEVIEAFVDKDTGARYEKKSTFDGTKERCGVLIKGGYLNKDVFVEPEIKKEDEE
ncbi:MAG: hypothetical protein PHI47_06495 [Sulfuricurvum sp.]|uniref:hypothetical protein n=1 Tax=Sulfuricurvum sp. TaxID=2025608 RepID=UPI002631D1A2|nr:hypothetical protein [Sulfuricurvum sp.]MDD5159683.1 hypothetical protein [Sulfuricurvum sp.]